VEEFMVKNIEPIDLTRLNGGNRRRIYESLEKTFGKQYLEYDRRKLYEVTVTKPNAELDNFNDMVDLLANGKEFIEVDKFSRTRRDKQKLADIMKADGLQVDYNDVKPYIVIEKDSVAKYEGLRQKYENLAEKVRNGKPGALDVALVQAKAAEKARAAEQQVQPQQKQQPVHQTQAPSETSKPTQATQPVEPNQPAKHSQALTDHRRRNILSQGKDYIKIDERTTSVNKQKLFDLMQAEGLKVNYNKGNPEIIVEKESVKKFNESKSRYERFAEQIGNGNSKPLEEALANARGVKTQHQQLSEQNNRPQPAMQQPSQPKQATVQSYDELKKVNESLKGKVELGDLNPQAQKRISDSLEAKYGKENLKRFNENTKDYYVEVTAGNETKGKFIDDIGKFNKRAEALVGGNDFLEVDGMATEHKQKLFNLIDFLHNLNYATPNYKSQL
jgi:hypothetical protein